MTSPIPVSTDWLTIVLQNISISSLDAVLIISVISIVWLSTKAKKDSEQVQKAIDAIKYIAYGAMALRVLMPIIEKILDKF